MAANHVLEDRFPGLTGPNSGASTFPFTRSVKVAGFSDTANLTFRCRGFYASAKGKLMVDTPTQENVEVQVVEGLNPTRLDRIYSTGSDALTIDIRD